MVYDEVILVGGYFFPTIKSAIEADCVNIKVISNVVEDETIYIRDDVNIVVNKGVQVTFQQKKAFVIDGGSLLFHGHPVGNPKKAKSALRCCRNCVLVSPLLENGPCDTFLKYFRIYTRYKGSVRFSGSNMIIDTNCFHCPAIFDSISQSSVSHNVCKSLKFENSVTNTSISCNVCTGKLKVY
jgi:hypothetical protein